MIISKICVSCGEDKALSMYTFVQSRDKHKASCKACVNQQVKDLRASPKHAERYKAKERERNAKRADYIKNWFATKQPVYTRKPAPAKTSCPVYFNTCTVTGQLFTAKRASDLLSKEGRLIKRRARDTAQTVKNATGNPRQCRQCASTYTTVYKATIKAFCSESCRDEAKRLIIRRAKRGKENHRRRARHFGVTYTPIDSTLVFDRDKWKCQLCGIKTPKAKRGQMVANAPELDHILPLSKGGTHEYYNVQCACRQCNGNKNNQLIGQLRLAIAA